MTIYGPFGGPALRAKDGLRERQAAVRSQFQGGTSSTEPVQLMVAEDHDLAVPALLEANSVKFAGREGTHPWILRVMEMYKRDQDGWRRLHRHADPLIKARRLADTLTLLAQ